MDSEKQSSAELLPLNPIRVETAISRYPVHRLARKGTIDINIREGNANGGETRWEVDYSKKYGQPGPLAYKLDTLIINRRIEEANRPVPKLIRLGSLKEICRELGLAETGGNTNQIKNSLSQNALAGITAKTRYRLSDGSERTLESVFTRYSVIFTGERLPTGKKADAVYVLLNDIFMQVINGAMTRPLDYDYLKSLPPAPQRFYEILSYQMYAALKNDRPRAKITYSDLCAHAPQTRHTDWNKVRSQMHKVHRPHRESGYIGIVNFDATTDRDGHPDWIMCYQPGPKARAEFRAFTKRGGPSVLEMEPFDSSPSLLLPASSPLEVALIGHRITPTIAAELVSQYGEDRVAFQIEHLEWLDEKKPGKVDDAAAWLVAAIKANPTPPKAFVTKAERERRAEVKRQDDKRAAEERRRKQQEEAKERQRDAAVDAYIKALEPHQLQQLEAAAIAAASEQVRQDLSNPSPMMKTVRRTMLSMTVKSYVGEMLDADTLPRFDS